MPALKEYDRPASYYMNQGVDGRPLPSISDRLRSMGMDSSVENRPMLMPVREEGEWTAPEWFHSMARGAMVPIQSVLGGTVTPLDTAMATADYAGGGLLSSKAIPNAVPDGSVLGATVWHGSPHRSIDKFDMSKVGRGTGVKAKGHGLYFTDDIPTAKGYADSLGHKGYKFTPEVEGKYRASLNELEDKYKLLGLQAEKKMRETYVDSDGYERLKSYDHPEVSPLMESQDVIGNQLTKLDAKMKAEGGTEITSSSLYKVDLPDEHIEKMLDWDKPVSEQTDLSFIANAIQRQHGRKPPLEEMITRHAVEREQGVTGGDLYQRLTDKYSRGGVTEADKMASEYLLRQGATGIKYGPQAGASGKNYVVFDDRLPTILGRE